MTDTERYIAELERSGAQFKQKIGEEKFNEILAKEKELRVSIQKGLDSVNGDYKVFLKDDGIGLPLIHQYTSELLKLININ